MNDNQKLDPAIYIFGLLLIVTWTMIILCIGENIGKGLIKREAISHNKAYYNPTNAVFMWKEQYE